MREIVRHLAAGALVVIIFPALCFAQFGAIAGVVKDSTGAVLPGVVVEAASPALIEKTRTAVSDSAGYKLEQLRPGVYTVTFTLTGFITVRREGIEISAGFTAPVNTSLKVGGVAETITVTGEVPVVDVQSISQQKTLPKEALDALPTARSFATLGATLPGVTQNQRDVGGSQGEAGNILSAHGGAAFDMTVQVDGVPLGGIGSSGGGAWTTFSLNDSAAQEISFQTGAISAESATGGVQVNVVPREGGNKFTGAFFGNFATSGMSASNYTADLTARGLPAPTGFEKVWDESAAVGGPIRRDKVWFFLAHRYRGNDVLGTGFYSKDPLAVVSNPDLSRPLHSGGWDLDNQVRVTAQVTPRNKVSGFFDQVNKCNCPSVFSIPLLAAEATTRLTYPTFGVNATSVSWQAPISSKLLWDSAFSYNRQNNLWTPNGPGITATTPVSVFDLTNFQSLRAPFPGSALGVIPGFPGQIFAGGEDNHQIYTRAALSYVTGSHAAKVGFILHTGARTNSVNQFSNDTQIVNLSNPPFPPGPVFRLVNLTTAPYASQTDVNADLGVYAQDKWTLRRLTVTGGVRLDYFNIGIPAQSAPASVWIGARSFAAIDDVPNWKDISPRVGLAYDLFGNGKTALKASASRYVSGVVYGFPDRINPIVAGSTTTRAWVDFNGDFFPQGDALNPAPNGEFIAAGDPTFGRSVVTTKYDAAVSQGWGKRPYNWEYSASVQHELLPRVSLEVGYFRRTFRNQTVIDNQELTPADFDPFSITVPTDPRLGSVSGSRVSGLYDFKPGKQLLTSNNLIRFASNYPGETSQTYDGIDINVNARPTGRLFLQAGFTTGRTVTKNCAQVDNLTSLRFCEFNQPFLGNYRLSGGYTFAWQIQVSGVFQSLPPDPLAGGAANPTSTTIGVADYTVTDASPGLTLGRPIATLGGTITVPLVDPSTYADYGDRVNQLDLRVTKGVRVGRYRVDVMADFYNAFNRAPVLTYQTRYVGPGWLAPQSILQSAYLKLGGRFTF
jgi:hypothetical protein